MRKGFTLVELLIAISLFMLAAVISSNILIDVVKLEKKTSIQNAIYEDLRIILQQLTNEIQNGTIDYEEYYSQSVVQALNPPAGGPFYGINYGVYGSRFYNPGQSLYGDATNPDDLGIECSYPAGAESNEDCEIYYTSSADLDTGKNPFDEALGEADAFCDETFAIMCDADRNEVEELYLIDGTGTKKTIIGRKRLNANGANGDWAIGIVKMEGRDLDQNGVIDVFTCTNEFDCMTKDEYLNVYGIKMFAANGPIQYPDAEDLVAAQTGDYVLSLPQQSDLDKAFDPHDSQFIPISPLRANVTDLRFIIVPVEDPYKAFAEQDLLSHPAVKIIMTLDLASIVEDEYPGGADAFDDITVQTTVAAGVLREIDSYPPVDDVISAAVGSWIDDVLSP